MNPMRHWMRLLEANAHRVRVFHGSPERVLNLEPAPLYGVRDFGFAASYGVDRSDNDHGFVHTLEFRFDNLCDPDTLNELFEQHRIEPWPSAAGVFIQHPEFMSFLTEAGYDGLTAHDFGFRSDFEELPVWMVVNAARQVTKIDVVEVTKDHLGQKHEPSDLTEAGRAAGGGEIGVNGYHYKGGQFLPSTDAPPGTWRVKIKGKSHLIQAKRELVAPGVLEYAPTPFSRAIFTLIREIVTIAPDGTLGVIDNPTAVNYYGRGITPGIKGVSD